MFEFQRFWGQVRVWGHRVVTPGHHKIFCHLIEQITNGASKGVQPCQKIACQGSRCRVSYEGRESLTFYDDPGNLHDSRRMSIQVHKRAAGTDLSFQSVAYFFVIEI